MSKLLTQATKEFSTKTSLLRHPASQKVVNMKIFDILKKEADGRIIGLAAELSKVSNNN